MKKIMTICLICILCGSMVQAQKIRIKTGIEVLKEQNFKRLEGRINHQSHRSRQPYEIHD